MNFKMDFFNITHSHNFFFFQTFHLKCQQPSKAELKKCIKSNLNPSEDFVRSYMRNLARLVSDRMHPRDDSSSADDSSDSDNDDDDDAQTIYQPCEVQ